MATIRARYVKGVLVPLEPLAFEDGEEVIVAVERTVSASQPDGAGTANGNPDSDEAQALFESAFGGWKDIIPEDFTEMIYQARIDGSRTPPDP